MEDLSNNPFVNLAACVFLVAMGLVSILFPEQMRWFTGEGWSLFPEVEDWKMICAGAIFLVCAAIAGYFAIIGFWVMLFGMATFQ